VATAVFANPNSPGRAVEEKARERYGAVDVYKTSFRALKLSVRQDERTFMSWSSSAPAARGRRHMIGPDAGEVIQGMAIAVKLGATKGPSSTHPSHPPHVAEEFVTMREKASA